mmetsp:Transcript_38567/g.106230  ORF Transcript_38567/g.106230 Transcript_38567/m.106230 type:complete len:223 (-) Transcript_38567:337-1005(-)
MARQTMTKRPMAPDDPPGSASATCRPRTESTVPSPPRGAWPRQCQSPPLDNARDSGIASRDSRVPSSAAATSVKFVWTLTSNLMGSHAAGSPSKRPIAGSADETYGPSGERGETANATRPSPDATTQSSRSFRPTSCIRGMSMSSGPPTEALARTSPWQSLPASTTNAASPINGVTEMRTSSKPSTSTRNRKLAAAADTPLVTTFAPCCHCVGLFPSHQTDG